MRTWGHDGYRGSAHRPAAGGRGQEPEDRRAARRTQLIEAGLQIMGTEGAAAATMRATCREAALTERYFYESFANRDELLVAVLDEVVLGARDTILDALEAAPSAPSALIRHVVKAFTNYVFKDPRDVDASCSSNPRRNLRCGIEGRELMAEFTNPISASLELMYGGEATDSANSELNSVGLFGALAFIYQAHTPSSKISRKRLVEHISLMVEAQATVNSTPARKE